MPSALFIGLTILNLGQTVPALNLIGMFIAGLFLSRVFPQCIFSASRYVGPAKTRSRTRGGNCVIRGIY